MKPILLPALLLALAPSSAFAQRVTLSLDGTWQIADSKSADEMPAAFTQGKVLRVPALPAFLKTYIDRLSFSFTDYLRQEHDSSTELHQWIRGNYLSFRELELGLILQGS